MLTSPGISQEQPTRVLIVDDDENFRILLTRIIQRLGFDVTAAEDGEDALALLHVSPFDLLISDYKMPRIDGLDLIRVVRDDPVLCNVYAILITSHDDAKITALTLGYDDSLSKSANESEVVAKVVAAKRVVARQRTLTAAAQEWRALATRDDLTGVATRRSVLDDAQRSADGGHVVGLAILDLDGFKSVNDNFGHLTGDRILRDVGGLLLRCTRVGDAIARYGGDEFLLLTVDTALEDLTVAAARLTQEIEKLQWRTGSHTLGISASFGVAHSALLPDATLEQLLDAADRDLYAKKYARKSASHA